MRILRIIILFHLIKSVVKIEAEVVKTTALWLTDSFIEPDQRVSCMYVLYSIAY